MRGINMRKIAEAIPGASGAEVKYCFFFKILYQTYNNIYLFYIII